jgi:exonuclease SbcD
VPLSVLSGFDYVALGHLHGRQRLAESVRYSGSPLAYSFSERHHTKGSWIADVSSAGLGHVEFVAAPVVRPLAVVTGTLAEVLNSSEYDGYADHFLSVTLTDTGRVDDAMSRVQRRFPHAVHLEWRPAFSAGGADVSYCERVAGKDTIEITREFVAHSRGSAVSPGEDAVLVDVVERQHAAAAESVVLAVDDEPSPLADIA